MGVHEIFNFVSSKMSEKSISVTFKKIERAPWEKNARFEKTLKKRFFAHLGQFSPKISQILDKKGHK